MFILFTAWGALENGTLLDAIVDGCTNAEEDRSMTSVGWGGRYVEFSPPFSYAVDLLY